MRCEDKPKKNAKWCVWNADMWMDADEAACATYSLTPYMIRMILALSDNCPSSSVKISRHCVNLPTFSLFSLKWSAIQVYRAAKARGPDCVLLVQSRWRFLFVFHFKHERTLKVFNAEFYGSYYYASSPTVT